MKNKFKIGDLVSAHPCNLRQGDIFMPGVGEIINIRQLWLTTVYDCEHNGKIYTYTKEQIYEYDPY